MRLVGGSVDRWVGESVDRWVGEAVRLWLCGGEDVRMRM